MTLMYDLLKKYKKKISKTINQREEYAKKALLDLGLKK